MGWSDSEEIKKCPPLPLQSCDSWMFVKENPDRKKKWNDKNNEVVAIIAVVKEPSVNALS